MASARMARQVHVDEGPLISSPPIPGSIELDGKPCPASSPRAALDSVSNAPPDPVFPPLYGARQSFLVRRVD